MVRWSAARRAPVVALALATGLTLAACGSDDEQATASLKSQILGNNALSGTTRISSAQASCIADGAVEDLGVATLQDYQVLDDDLDVDKKLNEVRFSGKDADRLAAVFLDCSDAEAIFEDRLVQQLAPKGKRRAKVESCVRRTVTPEAVQGILAQTFEKTEATRYSELVTDLAGCR